jgi:adenosine deaminase
VDGSGAVRDVIEDLYRMAGRPFPFPSTEAWIQFFHNPYEDIVAKFDTVTGVLQSAEALALMGFAYGMRRANEGHRYVEAKFAPQYHTRGGLTKAEAAAAMYGGLKKAQSEFGIVILPQLCIGRETDPATGVEIARIALEYDGEVALDLACAEAGNPPEKHFEAYALTFGSKVKRDCHAGEWVDKEPSGTYRARLLANVRMAIFGLRCDGISHAIPLCDDPELVRYCADNGIRVAGCPLSNERGGLINHVGELQIGQLLDQGVIYTLNADDDLFLPSMETVVAECDDMYGFTDEQCRKLEANVFKGAFSEAAKKLAP